jgi:hypothetical protein
MVWAGVVSTLNSSLVVSAQWGVITKAPLFQVISIVPTACQPSTADQKEIEFALVKVPSNTAAADELLAALDAELATELELLLASLDDELATELELSLLATELELSLLATELELSLLATELELRLLAKLELASLLLEELAGLLATELATLAALLAGAEEATTTTELAAELTTVALLTLELELGAALDSTELA